MKKKLHDYATPPHHMARGLKLMEKFLPEKYRRQFESDGYAGVLKEAQTLIEEGLRAL